MTPANVTWTLLGVLICDWVGKLMKSTWKFTLGKSNGWDSVTLIQRHESQFICEGSEQIYSFRWKIRSILIKSQFACKNMKLRGWARVARRFLQKIETDVARASARAWPALSSLCCKQVEKDTVQDTPKSGYPYSPISAVNGEGMSQTNYCYAFLTAMMIIMRELENYTMLAWSIFSFHLLHFFRKYCLKLNMLYRSSF